MLQLDDVQLYDLSEAGSLLFSDAVRLTRLARLRRVPAAQVEGALGLPAPWVEAESGLSGADPQALADYWLQRLAPPAATARRPRRETSRLPAKVLLGADEAARRLFASAAALERLDLDGTLPSLRVEGHTRYDAELLDLVAREAEGEAVRREAEVRRAEVRTWARFEYAAPAEPAQAPATFDALRTGAVPMPEAGLPALEDLKPAATPTAASEAPAAFKIPADLGLEALEPLEAPEGAGSDGPSPGEPKPPSKLISAEGFETVDED